MSIKYILSAYNNDSKDRVSFISFTTLKNYKLNNLSSENNIDIDHKIAKYIIKHNLPEVPIMYINEVFTEVNFRNRGYFSKLINDIKDFYVDCIICIIPYDNYGSSGIMNASRIRQLATNPLRRTLLENHKFIDISKFTNRNGYPLLVYPTGIKSKNVVDSIIYQYYNK